ncbi:hypothetical protein OsccyDRAFT_3082 [Leptolyngbyaceae cyanobacterium JSC-12]|nr:hypothetical protein OsccyDRAFT_3082 [Leptolyngbyaceae cyanobacterium JSC-12]
MRGYVTRRLKPTTLIFLTLLGLTLIVWVLRGLTILGFIPGAFLWVLIFTCILLAVLSNIR